MPGKFIKDFPENTTLAANDKIVIERADGTETTFGRMSTVANYLGQNISGVTIDQVTGLQGALDNKQPLNSELTNLATQSGAGFVVRTASATYVERSLANAAAGITWTNPAGTAGNPTPVLANDLAAVEGLSTTGLVRRTATDTWSAGTTVATAEIADSAVTYAKIQNVSATDKVLGRSTAGAGVVEEITLTSYARTLIDDADAATARATLGLTTPATTTPAALTKTDDTNVTLTLGGTPTTALLQATSVTVGWTGTLAAARLNANVVQSVTNDTNVTGAIATQGLTLGWTGTLAAARLNANVVQAITNDTNITGSITAQNLSLGWTGQLSVARGGTNAATASGARTSLGVVIGTDVQAYDVTLAALAGVTTAADKLIYATGVDAFATTDLTSQARGLLDDASYSAMRTTLGLAIGTDVQAYNAKLADVAGYTPTKGNLLIGNGSTFVQLGVGADTYVLTADSGATNGAAWAAPTGGGGGGAPTTSQYVTLATDAGLSNERVLTAGTAIGITDAGAGSTVTVAVNDAELLALAGLTSAADKVPYFTGSGTAAVTDFTSVARTLVNQTSQANMRTTGLGLGTAATMTGPSGTIVGTTDTQTLTNKTLTLAVVDNIKATQVSDGTASSGTKTLDVSAGYAHKLTNGGAFTLAFSNWAASGILSSIEIELVNGGAFTITWPTINWLKGDGTYSTTFSTMNVTLYASGTNTIIVWTTNGGTTLYGRAG